MKLRESDKDSDKVSKDKTFLRDSTTSEFQRLEWEPYHYQKLIPYQIYLINLTISDKNFIHKAQKTNRNISSNTHFLIFPPFKKSSST